VPNAVVASASVTSEQAFPPAAEAAAVVAAVLAAFVAATLVASVAAAAVCTADVVCAAGVLLLHAASSKPAAKHAATAATVCRCGSVMAISPVDDWFDEQADSVQSRPAAVVASAMTRSFGDPIDAVVSMVIETQVSPLRK